MVRRTYAVAAYSITSSARSRIEVGSSHRPDNSFAIKRLLNHVVVEFQRIAAFQVAIVIQKWMIGALLQKHRLLPARLRVDPKEKSKLTLDADHHFGSGRPDALIHDPNDLKGLEHPSRAS
jgi:hypothetical protein